MPTSSFQDDTFQLVLTTDGSVTYAFFLFELEGMQAQHGIRLSNFEPLMGWTSTFEKQSSIAIDDPRRPDNFSNAGKSTRLFILRVNLWDLKLLGWVLLIELEYKYFTDIRLYRISYFWCKILHLFSADYSTFSVLFDNASKVSTHSDLFYERLTQSIYFCKCIQSSFSCVYFKIWQWRPHNFQAS